MHRRDVNEHGGQENASLAVGFDTVPLDEARYTGGILVRGHAAAQ